MRFTTRRGEVLVHLPADLRAGDTLSGTVSLVPAGKGDRKRAADRRALASWTLALGGGEAALSSGRVRFTAPPAAGPATLTLRDAAGKVRGRQTIEVGPPAAPPATFLLPTLGQAGRGLRIAGPFDGHLETTRLTLGSTEVELLAESPRELLATSPTELVGAAEIDLEEEGTTVAGPFRNVGLTLSAERLDLTAGETTTLRVEAVGLEGLGEPLTVHLENRSPGTVGIEGGEEQTLTVAPTEVGTDGRFTWERQLTGRTRGRFGLRASVVVPATTPTTVSSVREALAGCSIHAWSFLLPPSVCRELGGRPSAADGALPAEAAEGAETTDGVEEADERGERGEAGVSTVRWLAPQPGSAPPSAAASGVPLRLEVAAGPGPVGVARFDVRRLPDGPWRPVGVDLEPADGLSAAFDPTGIAPGSYRLEATVAGGEGEMASSALSFHIEPAAGLLFDESYLDRQAHTARDEAGQLSEQVRAAEGTVRRLRARLRELREIDEVLDGVSAGSYRRRVKDALGRLEEAARPGKVAIPANLQRRVDWARRDLDGCRRRLDDLHQRAARATADRDARRAELVRLLAEVDAFYQERGWNGGSGYRADGTAWFGYVGDPADGELSAEDERRIDTLADAIHRANRGLPAAAARLAAASSQVPAAEADCAELEEALRRAEAAKEKGDRELAARDGLGEAYRELRDLLRPLVRWCDDHPELCPFDDPLVHLSRYPPSDRASWQRFWETFSEVRLAKRAEERSLEDHLHEEAKSLHELEAQRNAAERRAEELASQAEDAARAADERAEEQAKRAREERAEDERRAAEGEARQRQAERARREETELLERARSGDKDALEQLGERLGLIALNVLKVGGEGLGNIVRAVLAVVRMPDCACNLLVRLREVFTTADPSLRTAAASAYLQGWKDCAALPYLSSVQEGAQELSASVGRLPAEQRRKMAQAVARTIALRCSR